MSAKTQLVIDDPDLARLVECLYSLVPEQEYHQEWGRRRDLARRLANLVEWHPGATTECEPGCTQQSAGRSQPSRSGQRPSLRQRSIAG
jgi:hypothetical protein